MIQVRIEAASVLVHTRFTRAGCGSCRKREYTIAMYTQTTDAYFDSLPVPLLIEPVQ